MSIHQAGPFIEWIIATLEAGSLTVGDHHRPDGAGPSDPYVVVYGIPGGETSGSIDAPRSDATVAVQVTSSSIDPRQTRWLADKVRTLLDDAGRATLSDGRRIIWSDFPEGSPAVNRDDAVQSPRYFVPDRFEFGTA